MKAAFELHGVDPQAWVRADACRVPGFDDVIAILDGQKDAHTAGLLDRLAPLVELGLFPKADALPFEAMMDGRIVLSLFALPADGIKAALAELVIIRLHGMLVNRPPAAQAHAPAGDRRGIPRGRAASTSKHSPARAGLSAPVSPSARNIRATCLPISPGRSAPKSTLKTSSRSTGRL